MALFKQGWVDKGQLLWYSFGMSERLLPKCGSIHLGKNGAYNQEFHEKLYDYMVKACRCLRVHKPKLKVDTFGFLEGANYKPVFEEINLGIPSPETVLEGNFEGFRYTFKREPKTNFEIVLFCLFHEIGHHWHLTKHRKHWHRNITRYKTKGSVPLSEYTRQPLERVANQIGCILFNRLYLRKKYGQS